jgi:vitamin B12/bleomycin/antimicrobial peptide transport system ATP-binding/permease protein
LSTFEERIRDIGDSIRAPQQIAFRPGSQVGIKSLDLDLPDGTQLLKNVSFSVEPGEAMLLVGPTGVGKSTALRAMAGLWPFGRGEISLGEGLVMFVPQRPYIPLGTLRKALLYPQVESDDAHQVSDERLGEVLDSVGLGGLKRSLDVTDNWSLRLSLGEQQRLGFARALLVLPSVLIMDEATSALDEPGEAALYQLLREAPRRPTIISVGHRSTLRQFHDKVFDIARFI